MDDHPEKWTDRRWSISAYDKALECLAVADRHHTRLKALESMVEDLAIMVLALSEPRS